MGRKISLTFIVLLIFISNNTTNIAQEKEPPNFYWVPMRDDIRLATDVYYPKNCQYHPCPVILIRTPYNKTGAKMYGDHFANLGYIAVIQDTRGRFMSEGKMYAFINDAEDGYDTIEWIAQQKWCNGKIGAFGGSAVGIINYQIAKLSPPHLVCQVNSVAGASLYNGLYYQNGVFRLELVTGWLAKTKWDLDNLKLILTHPEFDEFWQNYDVELNVTKVNVPILHITGWYDVFQQSTINAFTEINKNGGNNAKGKQMLIIGPWTHAVGGGQKQGDLEFPKNVNFDVNKELVIPWFDYWLKQKPAVVDEKPAVKYYVTGDVSVKHRNWNKWETAKNWPVPATDVKFYFHENSVLSTMLPQNEKEEIFVFDPRNPIPTVGGNNLFIPSGPKVQQPVEKRGDVINFDSEVLVKPVNVTGRIKVILYASSSERDTDFTAKLCDVYPDSKPVLVTDGIIRAKYRNSFTTAELLEPNKVYKIEIDLWSASIVFNKGHRIRVTISSSNFPRFTLNPNTGENIYVDTVTINNLLNTAAVGKWQPFGEKDNFKKATNMVYHNIEYPSHIRLPIVDK